MDAREQGVRDAGALAPRQPGGHDRVGLVALSRVEDQRAAGHDHHHAPLRRSADLVDGRLVRRRELHVLHRPRHALVARVKRPLRTEHVAEPFGVRRLADDNDAGGVVRNRRRGVLAVGDAAASVLADPVEDRRARDHVGRAALPGQRPTAGLVADVVGVRARDVNVGVALDRQRVPTVLEQHLGLGVGSAATTWWAGEPTWLR